MPHTKHHIRLSAPERAQLEAILRKGQASALRQCHARILLLADANGPEGGWSDSEIARAAQTSIPTIERVRRICVEHGLERALERKDPEREYVRKLDGKAEAQLIALCCGEPPAGQARWTLRLLAGRLVELEIVQSISHEAVRQTLKKNELKPWQKKQWVIAPTASAEFVAAMEDVLEVYARAPDPQRPLVCLDECTKQLTREVRVPLPAAPRRSPRRPAGRRARTTNTNATARRRSFAPWRRTSAGGRSRNASARPGATTRTFCAHWPRSISPTRTK